MCLVSNNHFVVFEGIILPMMLTVDFLDIALVREAMNWFFTPEITVGWLLAFNAFRATSTTCSGFVRCPWESLRLFLPS